MPDEASQPDQQEGRAGLLLRSEDGRAYAIPESALEAFRLSDEEWAKVEANLSGPDDDNDVQGFAQYIGQFRMTLPYYTVWTYRLPAYGGMGDPWTPDTSYYPPLH
jgi:hypothetical protein